VAVEGFSAPFVRLRGKPVGQIIKLSEVAVCSICVLIHLDDDVNDWVIVGKYRWTY
jgi:hypothetical protein